MQEEQDIFTQMVSERYKQSPEEPVAEPETPQPEETPVVEEPTVEEPVTEQPTETPVDVEPSEPTSEKLKVDYKEWFSQNEETFHKYLKEKNTDYSQMSSEALMEMKFRQENPHLSNEDIKEELSDKYGIGQSKMSEDIADYENDDSDGKEELKEAKAFNRELARKQRELKKEVPSLVKQFEEAKANIQLPEFEIDAPKKVEEVKQMTAEEQYEELQRQAETYKNEQWIPQLKQSIDSFESVKTEVEYEDNGDKVVLNVDYKLSEADKKELLEEYGDYIVTAKDQEKYQDLDGFLKDKAPAKVLSKLLKTVAKEASAKARESFVKNDLLNYDDGIRRQTTTQGELSFAEKFLTATKK